MFASSGYLEVLYFQRPVGKPRVAEQVTQRNQAKYRAIRVWLHPARRFQAINQQPHTPLPEKRTVFNSSIFMVTKGEFSGFKQ